MLDLESPLDGYELIVLPDRIAPDRAFVQRLGQYLRAGGRVLATGRSLLDETAGRLALPAMKIKYVAPLDHCPFYMRVDRRFAPNIAAIDHCMYEPGLRVAAQRGARAPAKVVTPYFNRTAEHYCSHFHTPPARVTRDPAVVVTHRTCYINAPIFAAYARHGNAVYRQLVSACIERLLPGRIVRTSLPTSARVSVMDQRRGGPSPRRSGSGRAGGRLRRMVHLLHYPPTRRTEGLDIIEEPLPLTDVAIELALPSPAAVVEGVPERTPLPFEQTGNKVRFILPRIAGYQVVCVTTQKK
jgi:hypothetical protein